MKHNTVIGLKTCCGGTVTWYGGCACGAQSDLVETKEEAEEWAKEHMEVACQQVAESGP